MERERETGNRRDFDRDEKEKMRLDGKKKNEIEKNMATMGIEPMTFALLARRAAGCAMRPFDESQCGES